MSIKARVEDAEVLWRQDRKEGAWAVALIAAAATSRKRYPRPTPDIKSFKSFIRDVLPTLMYGKPLQGAPNPCIIFDQTPIEDIIYEHLRCNLIQGLREVVWVNSCIKRPESRASACFEAYE